MAEEGGRPSSLALRQAVLIGDAWPLPSISASSVHALPAIRVPTFLETPLREFIETCLINCRLQSGGVVHDLIDLTEHSLEVVRL